VTAPARKIITVDDERLAHRCAKGRIDIVDDDPEILLALKALIEFEGYAVRAFASAQSYIEASTLDKPQFPGPKCLLCDVHMPEQSGLELQRQLTTRPDLPLLLMSGLSGAGEVAQAFRAGALDFLIKPMEADVLLEAITKALKVSALKQREILLLSDLSARASTLSARERDVLHLVAKGRTNQTIAEELQIALRTVKLHRQHGMEKLGVNTTVELVRIIDKLDS
jgi:FixJ family two-component response regulator